MFSDLSTHFGSEVNLQNRPMLTEAVAYYNSLLEDDELARRSKEVLDEGLEHAKLIFGGRRLTPYLRPHFVAESDWNKTVDICRVIWGALQKVKDAAIENTELLDELGLTPIEKELVKIDPGYRQVSPTARLDSFLTRDGLNFVELNGESPAGIAYSDSASEIFASLPIMRKFAERYFIRGLEGRSKLFDVLISSYEEFLGGKPDHAPVIAIVDLKGLPTQKEFELFKEYFEYRGCTALICAPDQLEFDNGRLYFGGAKIDVVYKRLLVNEYLPIMAAYPALLEAYRAGAVCMVNNFRAKIIHKKAIFALITNEKYAGLFDAGEIAAIAEHIPWTRRFRKEMTFYHGAEIDLIEWTRANSQKLVLKPNDDYGGQGIFIGWNSNQEEWDSAINFALDGGDYLVQERVKTAKEHFPMIFDGDERFVHVEQLVDLDPLLFNGEVGSAFTRLSTSELANVTSGGGMVPTFIIEGLR